MRWQVQPREWRFADGALHIDAGEKTDLFTDPGGAITIANSPRLVFDPPGDFMLSASVSVPFASTYDAGVLLVHADAVRWGKLCFEFSPQGQPMIVSVVTKGDSDDCNSVVIDGNRVRLRIARIGRAFAFHYSTDGAWWHMVRYFNLGDAERISAGFSAQSPTGTGCAVTFEDIRFDARTLANVRSGV